MIVDHKQSTIPANYAEYFTMEPVYQDRDLTAFALADMRHQPPCEDIFDRRMDLPSPETPASISWDGKIRLLGHDLPIIDPESGMLSITVYWQALAAMNSSNIAYFHLVDSATGTVVAQADVIPRGWSYPTNWWLAGEVVEDTVQIPMEGVFPGRYELHVGWYDEKTGMRLAPASDQLQLSADGRVLLTIIEN